MLVYQSVSGRQSMPVKLMRLTGIHLLEQLENITSQGYKWDGLKRLRDKFTPTFTKFKDADRNHVPFKN